MKKNSWAFALFFNFSLFSMQDPKYSLSLLPMDYQEKFLLMGLPKDLITEVVLDIIKQSDTKIEFKNNIRSLLRLSQTNKCFHKLITVDGKKSLDTIINCFRQMSIRSFIHDSVFEACYAQNMNKAKFFLNRGNINTLKFFNGNSLFLLAAMTNNLDIAKLCSEYGSKIDFNEQYNDATAVEHAIKLNSVEFARLLIALGMDIDAKDSKGSTPLFKAIFCQSKNMVKFFLDHGADLKATNDRGETPLQCSKNYGFPKITKLIEDKIKEQQRFTLCAIL